MFGFESIVEEEIKQLGLQNIEVQNRAVSCSGTKTDLYRLNYYLRYAIRIIVTIKKFRVHSYADVYDAMQSIDWSDYIEKDDTFSIDAVAFSPFFKNSQFVMHKAKDAIADQFMDKYGVRPNVELKHPDLKLNIHINQRQMSLGLDSSGESLHIRGYKKNSSLAPLNEVLAAGLIKLSGWDMKQAFLDPMCGSGTLVHEAAMMAMNIPAQHARQSFGFMQWKDYDEAILKKIVLESTSATAVEGLEIHGHDIDEKVISDVKFWLPDLAFKQYIKIEKRDFFASEEQVKPYHIVTNPPYDQRISIDNIIEFYKTIGNTLKHKYRGSTAWIFSGSKDGIKHVGLKPSKKILLYNGPIESRFHKFEMY